MLLSIDKILLFLPLHLQGASAQILNPGVLNRNQNNSWPYVIDPPLSIERIVLFLSYTSLNAIQSERTMGRSSIAMRTIAGLLVKFFKYALAPEFRSPDLSDNVILKLPYSQETFLIHFPPTMSSYTYMNSIVPGRSFYTWNMVYTPSHPLYRAVTMLPDADDVDRRLIPCYIPRQKGLLPEWEAPDPLADQG